jgi:hypothetical protein
MTGTATFRGIYDLASAMENIDGSRWWRSGWRSPTDASRPPEELRHHGSAD